MSFKRMESPGWKTIGINLPPSVAKIIIAADGDAPPKGKGFPHAMAAIVGALPYIAAAIQKELEPGEYAMFVRQLHGNLEQVWSIVTSDDAEKALRDAIDAAKRGIN